MTAVEREMAISLDGLMRFQLLSSHIFDQARLGYDTATLPDISRRTGHTELKMAATETGSGNNY